MREIDLQPLYQLPATIDNGQQNLTEEIRLQSTQNPSMPLTFKTNNGVRRLREYLGGATVERKVI